MANILLRTLDHSFGQNLVKSKEIRLIYPFLETK